MLQSIEEQGKLTDELKEKILGADTHVKLEDLYRPYKQRKKTRADVSREKGLEGLGAFILEQNAKEPVSKEAEKYITGEKDAEGNDISAELRVLTAEDAIKGAQDIIAEQISDNADYRTAIREMTEQNGSIISSIKKEKAASKPGKEEGRAADPNGVYETYYEFEQKIDRLPGHQILALNRGEKEKVLSVSVEAPTAEIISFLEGEVIKGRKAIDWGDSIFAPRNAAKSQVNKYTEPMICEAIRDAYERLIAPSIEREIRAILTEKAEDSAITVFGKNLSQLLMQAPVAGLTVLGWDPAFRTGCKLAVVDPTGKVLDTAVVYPTAPTNDMKIRAAKDKVKSLIRKYGIKLISIGNGTASRESEIIVAEIIKELKSEDQKCDISYVITNEAGASVYSASKLATEEFPNFDVGQRSAASIARRVQDPLAELVKIDPKSIGVGQYQHDMDQKKLEEALGNVVEDCVNSVGVDLNTASASLLTYISGVTKKTAKAIVDYREANGSFNERKELLKVSGLGPKAYEQCAGFLRIRNGRNPLDNTGVHPESYKAAEWLLSECGMGLKDISAGGAEKAAKGAAAKVMSGKEKADNAVDRNNKSAGRGMSLAGGKVIKLNIKDYKGVAERLGIGEPTLRDIVNELERPGRDPRDDMPPVVLRADVLEMKDLKEGMVLKGTVRNVIDFGAFVDIGVHQDGLVHISQLTDKKFVKHPLDVVKVGDIVDVKVLSVDMKRNRISLSMII